MSFHRENVIFQAADGTWGRGFFTAIVTGGDPEWDVEYDPTTFEWATTGHRTEDAAAAAWLGANPGSSTIITQADHKAAADRYAAMAAEYVAAARERTARKPYGW